MEDQRAYLVFYAMVEGEIMRLLGVFNETEAKKMCAEYGRQGIFTQFNWTCDREETIRADRFIVFKGDMVYKAYRFGDTVTVRNNTLLAGETT